MVTADEIGRVTVFAALDPADRDRLSRVAVDISLMPGEYAVHEGDERALFAVIDGRIEPIKLVDGIERVVGERRPGDIFGEVPMTLGTVLPVGFRAATKSRVMRIEPHDTTQSQRWHRTSVRKSGGWQPTGSADRAACGASRPTRRRPGRSSSDIGGMPRAPSCDTSWSATRSRSSGLCPMRRRRLQNGVEHLAKRRVRVRDAQEHADDQ